jgi:molybdate/tungstate transport system substrate-binding protein
MDITNRDASISVLLTLLIILTIAVIFIAGCTEKTQERIPLRVVIAGSLIQPFEEIEKKFESMHPDIDVRIEGHGSIQAIRQVTDLNRPFDLIAVADESLIPVMMYHPMKTGEKNWTDSYVRFGKTEMVLAYTNTSRYASEISEDNWYEIIQRPDVRFGLSNPVLDAAGYRALMVLALADKKYSQNTILSSVCTGHFSPEIHVTDEEGRIHIRLPDVMKPTSQKVVIRDGSIFLLSLLETGGIDYTLEYLSVASGTGLSYIRLPPEVNLGDSRYQKEYQNISVDLNFQRFSSLNLTRTGTPIVYAAAIPATSSHPDEASSLITMIMENSTGIRGMPQPL